MQNNLLIQNEGTYEPQDLNQPDDASPAPQPHIEQAAQIPTQPTQPIAQAVPQPYIIQTSQPYLVQVAPQQYVVQPNYSTQPGVFQIQKILKEN